MRAPRAQPTRRPRLHCGSFRPSYASAAMSATPISPPRERRAGTTARAAGWDDGAIVELVGHATATILTNYLHHLSQVPVDFPSVPFAEAVDASVVA